MPELCTAAVATWSSTSHNASGDHKESYHCDDLDGTNDKFALATDTDRAQVNQKMDGDEYGYA